MSSYLLWCIWRYAALAFLLTAQRSRLHIRAKSMYAVVNRKRIACQIAVVFQMEIVNSLRMIQRKIKTDYSLSLAALNVNLGAMR